MLSGKVGTAAEPTMAPPAVSSTTPSASVEAARLARRRGFVGGLAGVLRMGFPLLVTEAKCPP
jgi:hypothetical protein